jgi:tRNA pseudouridine65 synthase
MAAVLSEIVELRDGAFATGVAPLMDILFQDPHLLIVNKPSGLLTHRGWANDRDNALVRARSIAGTYVYPAHRLDRATSGVLVFGLSQAIASTLGKQLEAGAFGKRYIALVRGIAPDSAVIDHPLSRLSDEEGREAKSEEKQPARTRISRAGSFERYSLVLAEPETGRSHQIRRHLKHISCPILGDTRYGKGEHNRACRERFSLHRLALHAASLAFEHPVTGERIAVSAAIPTDLAAPLEAMSLLEPARAMLAAG